MELIRNSFHHLGFHDKKYNWYGISKKNIIKMRPYPGAKTIDICNYIKPKLRQKTDVANYRTLWNK